jgi:argininosuccinate synthase
MGRRRRVKVLSESHPERRVIEMTARRIYEKPSGYALKIIVNPYRFSA